MSEEQIKALWVRTDSHSKEIGELRTATGVIQARQADIDARFDRFMTEQANGRAEILTQLKSYDDRVQAIMREHWRREGASTWKSWAIPIIVSVMAVGVSVAAIALK